jgi:hypothetical protein
MRSEGEPSNHSNAVFFTSFWWPLRTPSWRSNSQDSPFNEFRRSRSGLHTTRDRKRKVRIFEPSRGSHTPLTRPLKSPLFLCRSRPRYPQLLKVAVSVFVADERTLNGPEDLTDKTTAQTGFSTQRGLDGQASSIRPGALTPDPPPSVASSRTWMDPRVGMGR